MNELHETALHYARYGWHIIPLVPNQKIPLTSNGVLDASCDLAQIDAWWRQWPRANIGISAFASGFHIIDIDTKSGDGLAEWRQLTSQHETPETACVRTPSGGWHVYYLNRVDSLPNRKLSPNIDTRGLNGYVVAPPSVCGGVAYTWHFTPEPSGVGIQLLPNWIRESLTAEQETAHTSCDFSTISPVNSPKLIDFVKTRGFLPARVLRYLESTDNKNEQDQAVLAGLSSRGLTPEQVKGVFMAYPAWQGVQKRKRKPEYYLDLSIERASSVSVKLFKIGNVPAEVSAW